MMFPLSLWRNTDGLIFLHCDAMVGPGMKCQDKWPIGHEDSPLGVTEKIFSDGTSVQSAIYHCVMEHPGS